MKISRAGVSRVADVSDDLALLHKFARRETIGVTLQVSIIENDFRVGAQLINRRAAAFALEEFYDFAIGCGEDWSSGRRGKSMASWTRPSERAAVNVSSS